MWQDWVMAVCSVGFTVALVPQVVKGFRDRVGYITLSTAALTTGGLALFAVALLTKGFWWAGSAEVLACGLWGVLLVQRFVYGPALGTARRAPTDCCRLSAGGCLDD